MRTYVYLYIDLTSLGTFLFMHMRDYEMKTKYTIDWILWNVYFVNLLVYRQFQLIWENIELAWNLRECPLSVTIDFTLRILGLKAFIIIYLFSLYNNILLQIE